MCQLFVERLAVFPGAISLFKMVCFQKNMSRYGASDVKVSWRTLSLQRSMGQRRNNQTRFRSFLTWYIKCEALQCVHIIKVDYLPQITFTPLGVFSKMSCSVGSVIPGVTDFLSEMASEDFQKESMISPI